MKERTASRIFAAEALVALGLKAVIATVGLSGVDVDASLRVTLTPVTGAMLNVTIQCYQAAARAFEILPGEVRQTAGSEFA